MTQLSDELVQSAMGEVSSITCDEYRALKTAGEDHVFLDVREPGEWEAGHVEGAMHIPRGMLEFQVEEKIPDKNKKIILCCARGGRAALAGQSLKKMGYANLQVLKGGYNEYCENA